MTSKAKEMLIEAIEDRIKEIEAIDHEADWKVTFARKFECVECLKLIRGILP
jgi:hypothetical protein